MLAAFALTGCATVDYYAQSVTGHLGLMYRARPIETVIAAPDTEPRLAARLRTALDIRDFASDALGLPANASYRRIAAARRAAFLALVRGARRDLEAVYASSRSDAEKREAKAGLIKRLRARYAALRATWKGGPTYDFWFERGVNNAAIALVSTYDRWVPALEALLAQYSGDLQAFYRASDALAALSPDERRAELEELERTARRRSPATSLSS